jgi:hypothetical protein
VHPSRQHRHLNTGKLANHQVGSMADTVESGNAAVGVGDAHGIVDLIDQPAKTGSKNQAKLRGGIGQACTDDGNGVGHATRLSG